MKQVLDKCSKCDCGGKRIIVNKKYYLCQEKNWERLHGVSDVKVIGFNSFSFKSTKPIKRIDNFAVTFGDIGKVKKKQKPIKKVSEIQSQIEREYNKICIHIDYTREPVCSGCLRYQGGEIRLSHSHIISRNDCKGIGRLDLIYNEDNITYHCMDFREHKGCHRMWENPKERNKLIDYQKNIDYIESISEEMYNKYKVD